MGKMDIIDYFVIWPVIGICAFLFIIISLQISTNNELVKEIKDNQSSITFYLDGKEIYLDNIDINQYQISYDRENNKVFLTKKPNIIKVGL